MDLHILVRQNLRKLEVLLREHLTYNRTNCYFLYATVTHFTACVLRSTSIALRILITAKFLI